VKKLLVIFIFIAVLGLIVTPSLSQAQDADDDGISDTIDNCPDTPNGPDGGTCIFTEDPGSLCSIPGANPWECGEGGFCSMNQEDTDKDGIGNACDDCPKTPGKDADSDGICGDVDNCPTTPNAPDGGTCSAGNTGDPCTSNGNCGCEGECSLDQEDKDDDGVGDVCDNCPKIENGPDAGTCRSGSIEEVSTVGNTCTNESECGTDGNCSMDQEDQDDNGVGDVCDPNNITILIVGTGNGAPGSTDNFVEVGLQNSNGKVGGGQIDICDVDDYLTCSDSCEITERTSAFTCAAEEQESGCCKILLIDLEGEGIEEGEGAIFTLSYDVSKNASSGECTELNAESITIRDENNQPLEKVSLSGEFCFISTTTSTPSSTTTSIPSSPSISISPDPLGKSHWIPLPYLIVIAGNNTSFAASITKLLYEPSGTVFSLFPLVLNNLYIWDIVWVMPGWLTGLDDETVTLTVTTDSEVVEDNFEIELFPFPLDHQRSME